VRHVRLACTCGRRELYFFVLRSHADPCDLTRVIAAAGPVCAPSRQFQRSVRFRAGRTGPFALFSLFCGLLPFPKVQYGMSDRSPTAA
jgi:hypothetical protein